jgi:hypothetical protein
MVKRVARWSAALVVLLVLVGCGSSSPTPVSSNPAPVTSAPKPAGPNPSESAKMICAGEAPNDVATRLGVNTIQVTTPSWVDHVYSCQYQYSDGVISMSVKELNSAAETQSYSDALGNRLGRTQDVAFGQGGFVTTSGSVVVTKDWKVLLVDVSQLPDQFGTPPLSRSGAALSVAGAIMGCWTGA